VEHETVQASVSYDEISAVPGIARLTVHPLQHCQASSHIMAGPQNYWSVLSIDVPTQKVERQEDTYSDVTRPRPSNGIIPEDGN
jgi:hypothetical protein